MIAATDWNPLIASLAVSVPTILGLIAAWLDLRRKAAEAKKDLAEVKDDVQKIEIATNSMKDALIKSTRSEALLQGAATEKTRADAEQGQQAKGALNERARADSHKDPASPVLIVENGKVVADDVHKTPIVVDVKGRPPIVPDKRDEKG